MRGGGAGAVGGAAIRWASARRPSGVLTRSRCVPGGVAVPGSQGSKRSPPSGRSRSSAPSGRAVTQGGTLPSAHTTTVGGSSRSGGSAGSALTSTPSAARAAATAASEAWTVRPGAGE